MFQVKGTFLNALQCLLELHYVFDLEYALEMKPLFILLEHLAGIKQSKMSSTLHDLYSTLLIHAGKFVCS